MPSRHSFTQRGLLPLLCVICVTASASGQVANEDHKLLASDGAANDRFSLSIAIGGGTVAVGALWNDETGTNSGAAYLYSAANGAQTAILHANDGLPYDTFGSSIAIDNAVVAVGAMNRDEDWVKSGAAYLFDASTGVQLFKLLPSIPVPSAQFGNSIAIGGGVVAVGCHFDGVPGSQPGAVFLFDVSTGLQTAKLVAADRSDGDEFGHCLAIDNGIVAIGVPKDDDNGSASGSALLFDAHTGQLIAKLLPNDGSPKDRFGWSIAINDGVVAVGAYLDDDNGNNSGSVYLFDARTGDQIAKVLPAAGQPDDWFGWSVALDSGLLAVTSTAGDDFLFDVTTGDQIRQLIQTDAATGDSFGWSVAMDGGVVAVGSLRDDDNGEDSGSAYLFDVTKCPADLTGDGQLDFFDVFDFLTLFAANDPSVDFTGDGTLDFFDVVRFLELYAEGCP